MCEIKKNAYAKINLGLDVTGLREDGYHEVKMVMQSLLLHDTVTLRKTGEQEETPGIRITVNDPALPTDRRNLCYKAAERMLSAYGISEGISIDIRKEIPIAAGLAGGSTDAAAVLAGINELFSLGVAEEELMAHGKQIGADVPFCLMGGTALSEGIGEKLTALPAMPAYPVLLFKPDTDVSTASVYKRLDEKPIEVHPDIDGMVAAIRRGEPAGVFSRMGNVLAAVTEEDVTIVPVVKEKMKALGALGAMMSGSGPTVFGIFGTEKAADDAYAALKKEKWKGRLIRTALFHV